jgi:hypothetical protein
MRTQTSAICLLLIALATACDSARPDVDLHGQWVIRITATSVNGHSVDDREVMGILVFDNALPLWAPSETLGLDPPFVKGRLFAPVARLMEGPVSETLPAAYHRQGRGPDLADEVVASTSAPEVFFVLAPGVIGGRIEFSGIADGDTVLGSWTMPPHPTSMEGRFRMWRTENHAALDSARAQARRTRDHKSAPQGVPVDTL